ncbi:hypothetical protein ACFPRL_33000 [Pseudoclavibacter helvolus]
MKRLSEVAPPHPPDFEPRPEIHDGTESNQILPAPARNARFEEIQAPIDTGAGVVGGRRPTALLAKATAAGDDGHQLRGKLVPITTFTGHSRACESTS